LRALVQRVSRAAVTIAGEETSGIGPGLLVLVGVARDDDEATADRLAKRVRALRVFEDSKGRMSEALGDREILCVSQFTLCADTSRGNRPSFSGAAPAEAARPLYERFCECLGAIAGGFGARMAVELVNDGPVTLILDA
jgi:D-tyrosyl-tRNA(Tyr) deacylase